jgi:hypothetical protein
MEAVIQVTRFRDGGPSTDFSLGFGDCSPEFANPSRLPPVSPKAEFSPC